MLNFDKYREKIEKLDGYSLNCGLAELRGFDQDRCEKKDCGICAMNSLQWLVKKYEPPMLKNGDGLKPGDEILVKNSNYANWEREKFLCYLDRLFFTTYNLDLPYSPEEFRAACWRYARLPEDGE